MNTEHLHVEKSHDLDLHEVSQTKSENISSRVNMSSLIARFKKEKAKEKKETMLFVGLACALVVISGIIVSL